MNDKKSIWSFWLSLLAFVISLVALVVFIFKVEPYSVVSSDTFIGVIAAFIGISVTMVIGFQIYNSLDLKSKINAVEELKKTVEEQKSRVEKLKIEQEEGINIIQARLYHGTSMMELDTFLRLHAAIKFSLSADHKQEGYKWILDELETYMLDITTKSFSIIFHCISEADYKRGVSKFKGLYQDDEKEIRQHPNFLYIKDRYEELMSKFEKRLENIANLKTPSSEEIDKLAEKIK